MKTTPGSRIRMGLRIREELPGYDDPLLIGLRIPKGFSYPVGNMGDKTYLNLLSTDGKLRISIDAREPYHRDNPESPRFYIQERDEAGEYKTMVTSDDWNEILICIQHWNIGRNNE